MVVRASGIIAYTYVTVTVVPKLSVSVLAKGGTATKVPREEKKTMAYRVYFSFT